MKTPRVTRPSKSDSLSRADVLLHPVRLRVALALQGRRLTPQQIGAVLTDVPPATLYRHINRLAEAGIIAVVEQHPVHGTQERVYAIVDEAVQLDTDDFASSSPEDYRRYFNALIATLISSFDRFIAAESGKGKREGFMFYEDAVYLSESEFRTVTDAIREMIFRATANPADVGRQRRLLAAIAITEPKGGDSVTGDEEPAEENRELPDTVDRPLKHASDAGI